MGPQSLEGSNIKYSRICSLLIVGILFTKLDMAKPPSYPYSGREWSRTTCRLHRDLFEMRSKLTHYNAFY